MVESLHALCDNECMGYLLMSHPDQTIIMLIILGYDVIFQGRIRVWWLNRRSVIPGERYPLALPFIALAAALDNGLKKIKKW